MAEKFEPRDWDSRHQEDRKPMKREERKAVVSTVAQ